MYRKADQAQHLLAERGKLPAYNLNLVRASDLYGPQGRCLRSKKHEA